MQPEKDNKQYTILWLASQATIFEFFFLFDNTFILRTCENAHYPTLSINPSKVCKHTCTPTADLTYKTSTNNNKKQCWRTPNANAQHLALTYETGLRVNFTLGWDIHLVFTFHWWMWFIRGPPGTLPVPNIKSDSKYSIWRDAWLIKATALTPGFTIPHQMRVQQAEELKRNSEAVESSSRGAGNSRSPLTTC